MAFIFKITTTASPQTFTIPCQNVGVFNATIDWGDGGATSTITSYNDVGLAHSYATAGQYTITVTGTFTNIYFNNSGDKLLVDEVVDLGDVGWRNLSSSFYGCTNMTSFLAPTANTSAVTSMASMFRESTATTIDVSGFDTSAVTSMHSMFRNSVATTIDVSSFDTSAVTDTRLMFSSSAATDLAIDGWDISNVTNMSNFLTGVTLPISRYDSTLIAWSKQSVQPGITVNFGNSKYSSKVGKDRSARVNDVTPYGTVIKAPVATGAELMAYSGFSSSNYIKQEYNSDLDFGTGDFFIGSWIKGSAILSTATIFARTTSSNTGIHFYKDTTTISAKLVVRLGSNIIKAVTGGITDNAWHFVAVSRSGTTVTLWQDGIDVLNPTGTPDVYSLNVSDSAPVVNIGFSLIDPLAQSLTGISLLRVGTTAPTAVQILKIYNDELPLFQPKAAATIAGTSDSVTDISVDNDTTKLHVGTSFGRSVFNGLEREYNLVNPITEVIDASGGLILEK